MSSRSFGEVRALLHGRDEKQDVWRALLGIWQKLSGPEHATMRAQMAHYVSEHIARDPTAWAACERRAPRAWTNPHVEHTPREFDPLYNSLELPLTHISTSDLLAHLQRLDLDPCAITRLELDVFAEDAEKIASLLEVFPHVEHLICDNEDQLSLDLEAWRQLPAPRALKRLELRSARLGSYGMEHLLGLDWLPKIRHLNLEWGELSTTQVAALCEVGFERLEVLDLEYCGLSAEGVATLCDHASMRHVRELDINLNGLYGECGEFLAQAVFAGGLERLDLGYNRLSDAGIMQLCTHDFPSLRDLQVSGNDLGGVSMQRLAGAPFTPRLERLGLSFTRGVVASEWLALYEKLEHLRHIDMSFCELSEQAIRGLGSVYRGVPIEGIHLASVDPKSDPDALVALVEAIDSRHLRELSLSGNRLDEAHLLAMSSPLPELTELFLEENASSARGLAHLLSLIPSHRLQLLNMGEIAGHDTQSAARLREEFERQQISQLQLCVTPDQPTSFFLGLIEACAHTLEYLTLRISGDVPRAFYAALGELRLDHLYSLDCEGITTGYMESFEALSHTKLIEAATLETLSWRRPESYEGPAIQRPAGASPWLTIRG